MGCVVELFPFSRAKSPNSVIRHLAYALLSPFFRLKSASSAGKVAADKPQIASEIVSTHLSGPLD
jgi:hypothetical protein